MSHTFCPECGDFVQMDSQVKFVCTSCGYTSEDEVLSDLLDGIGEAPIGYILDDNSVTEDFGL